jgi:lipopolysaccharide transport system ATP-binding protein
MPEIAISLKNISKKYRLFNSPQDRFWEALHPFNKKYHKEFWALKDVSFDVLKGQTVGIIGRNGSGKSTILQILCSILRPTSGEVTVNGRVSALLELGSGFNPEFTGRQNVMMKGMIMGFSEAEMRNRFPEIEAFADIGEFIDQPMKIYSSGMSVRLAFATAINVDPDILVIDEALAVGDTGNFWISKRQERPLSSSLMTPAPLSSIATQRFCLKEERLLRLVNQKRSPIIIST